MLEKYRCLNFYTYIRTHLLSFVFNKFKSPHDHLANGVN